MVDLFQSPVQNIPLKAMHCGKAHGTFSYHQVLLHVCREACLSFVQHHILPDMGHPTDLYYFHTNQALQQVNGNIENLIGKLRGTLILNIDGKLNILFFEPT